MKYIILTSLASILALFGKAVWIAGKAVWMG